MLSHTFCARLLPYQLIFSPSEEVFLFLWFWNIFVTVAADESLISG
jgi:hypothetical protein